jgi:diacylglycerol kinase family enzyme
MDVGLLNGRPFLNVAGVGFDAAVGHAFHDRGRKGGRRGFLGYVRLSLLELRAYHPSHLTIEVAPERLDLMAFVATFANGPQYGSGAVINPGGKLDDGRLELVVFESGPLWRTLAAASRLFLGGLERSPGYRRLSAPAATVTAAPPAAVHCDGDPAGSAGRIDVQVLPLALEIMVPTTTASDPGGPFSIPHQGR